MTNTWVGVWLCKYLVVCLVCLWRLEPYHSFLTNTVNLGLQPKVILCSESLNQWQKYISRNPHEICPHYEHTHLFILLRLSFKLQTATEYLTWCFLYWNIISVFESVCSLCTNPSRWWTMFHRVRSNSAVAVPAGTTYRQIMPGFYLLDGWWLGIQADWSWWGGAPLGDPQEQA